ncbi:hypothetical protein DdX_20881 [Ditylenchus destructor]|uniref:Uncharacterized protein n=1 Tax=Ditylenchus destructor TaxID=166010 RepID=A0AAD4QW61_9BILA|nr:hypothetical protein DdX_20881 [Ditylenchus destructor]
MGLVAQMAAFVFGLLLPVLILLVIAFVIANMNSNLMIMLAIPVLMFKCLLNTTLTIVLITPYRLATLRILRRITGRGDKATTVVFLPTAVSVQTIEIREFYPGALEK